MNNSHQTPDPLLRSLVSFLNGLDSTLNAHAQTINAFVQQANAALANVHRMLEQIDFMAMARMAQLITIYIETLPERDQRNTRIWAQHGWYLDPELPFGAPEEIAEVLEAKPSRAHLALCRHFERRLTAIEKELGDKFPRRAKLLRSGFRAHRRKEYELSILTLLTQADGICRDVTGRQLFSKKNGGLAPVLIEPGDRHHNALLTPLLETTPLTESTHKLGNRRVLNRHGILHGEHVDFASRLHSLQCVSLLVFLVWALEHKAASEAKNVARSVA